MSPPSAHRHCSFSPQSTICSLQVSNQTRRIRYVALDPVDVSGFTAATVSAWTHIDSTGYEDKDAIRVWAECSSGAAVDVVTGVLDDAAHPVGASGSSVTENEWIPHIASLPSDCGTVTVKFGCQMNSNSEECWFDMIEIVEAGGVRVASHSFHPCALR